MDEVSFGPKRDARRPSRRLRALGVAVVVAGAAAAGVGLAVTAAGAPPAVTSPPASQAAGLPVPLVGVPGPGCAPTATAWPNLASLPAGMRTAARPVIIDEQFSGRCPAR